MTTQPSAQPAALPTMSDEVTRRILFTLGVLVIYRLGNFLPLPGINPQALTELLTVRPSSANWLGANEAMRRVSIFGLGVTPYVTASVLLYLASGFSERLRVLRLSAGAPSRRQFNQYIRVGALILAAMQAYAIAIALEDARMVLDPGFVFRLSTVVSLLAGTILLIWLGEQISARGICDGIWLLFAASFIAELPANVAGLAWLASTAELAAWVAPAYAALFVALTALIVLFERAERRIAVRASAADRSDGVPQASLLRLRLDNSGILAPVLASTLLTVILTLAALAPEGLPWVAKLVSALERGQPLNLVLYAGLIVFFFLFFAAAAFDTRRWVAEVGGAGGSVQGIPEGVPMAAYLDGVLTRIAFLGALYLTLICLVPELLTTFAAAPFYLGGTSLLVAVLVAMDAIQRFQVLIPRRVETTIDGP